MSRPNHLSHRSKIRRRLASIMMVLGLVAGFLVALPDVGTATTPAAEQAKLTASDGAAFDLFGGSVSISGDTAVVGSRGDDDAGADSGSVYVFVRSGTTWTEQAKLTASDAASFDGFGFSVAVSGDTAVVGSRRDDDAGTSSGSAYVFVPETNQPPLVAVDTDPVVVDEGTTALNTGTVSDPDGDTVTLTSSVGTVVNNGDGTWSWSYPTDDGPTESQTVTISGDDGNGGTAEATFTLTVNNVAPTITAVIGPAGPVDIGDQSTVIVGVSFTDPGSGDTHDVSWEWGDSNSDTQPGVTSPASQSHTYTQTGVYPVTVIVEDDDGGSDTEVFEFVVVYDPAGGFATGGGWIDSPAGALVADPTLAGKATFGFVSQYKQGASLPTGNTQFQFHAGDLDFHSDSYDWLVIAGLDKAKFKGVGTINESGNHGFLLTAVDNGNSGDTFRIKIWDIDNTDTVVYDNKTGIGDDSHDGTVIGGGNIKVHKK